MAMVCGTQVSENRSPFSGPEAKSFSIEKAKAELLQSLHHYFVNDKNLFCYAQRLTELMEIISAVEVRVFGNVRKNSLLIFRNP